MSIQQIVTQGTVEFAFYITEAMAVEVLKYLSILSNSGNVHLEWSGVLLSISTKSSLCEVDIAVGVCHTYVCYEGVLRHSL